MNGLEALLQPARVLVLGDLVHAASGLDAEVVEAVAAWRRGTATVGRGGRVRLTWRGGLRTIVADAERLFNRLNEAPPRGGLRMGTTDPQIDSELWSLFAARRPQAPIQVASIDTARGKDLGRFDLLIFDEAHRSLSPSYLALAKEHESAVLLGLTATPYRLDGRGFAEIADALVEAVTPRRLVEAGVILDPVYALAPARERSDDEEDDDDDS